MEMRRETALFVAVLALGVIAREAAGQLYQFNSQQNQPREELPLPDLNFEQDPVPALPDQGDSSAGFYGDTPSVLEDSEVFGSGPSGCDCDICTHKPCKWRIQNDGLWLRRRIFGTATIASGTGTVTSDQLNSNREFGPQLSVWRRLGCRKSLEVRYFGLWALDDQTSLSSGTFDYETRLHNGEINLHYSLFEPEACAIDFGVLAGARYFNLHDELWISSGAGQQIASVDNDLIGAQLGGLITFRPLHRFEVTFDGKAGIFGNIVDAENRGLITASSAPGEDAAFIGELRLTGTYWVRPNMGIRGGYQVVWLDGVGLAPENVAAAAPFEVNHNGSVMFEGGFIGGEVRW